MRAEDAITPTASATTLLVTGFGPFLDVVDNASGQLATVFAQQHPHIGPHRVESVVLPVAYADVAAFAARTAARADVVGWLALGVGRSPSVRLERGADNTVTSSSPDVTGCACPGHTLVPSAAPRLETTLPLDAWLTTLDAGERPVVVSSDPGGYICNALYFRMLHHAGSRYPVLFLHIPRDLAGAGFVQLSELLAQVAIRATS